MEDEEMKTHLQFINALAPLQLDQLKDFIRQTAAELGKVGVGLNDSKGENEKRLEVLTEQVQTEPEIIRLDNMNNKSQGETGKDNFNTEIGKKKRKDYWLGVMTRCDGSYGNK